MLGSVQPEKVSAMLLELQTWELLSYVVTVFGLPYAIFMYLNDQRREQQNEDEEMYQRLADEYADFSKLLIENADLRLMTGGVPDSSFTPEQRERRTVIFDMLVSLFERAYIIVYEEKMNAQSQRLWATWDDYIRFWCARPDFRAELPALLSGEDPDFGNYIRRVVKEVAPPSSLPAPSLSP